MFQSPADAETIVDVVSLGEQFRRVRVPLECFFEDRNALVLLQLAEVVGGQDVVGD